MADYYDTVRRLFNNVLYEDIRQYQLNQADIRTGIQNMKEVYKPNPTSLYSETLDVADYNDPAHRCAYLHKYAPLHTALVRDMLRRSMEQVKFLFHDILWNAGKIEVCSLGGGPGSDILGVISVLSAELGFFQLSATIIDCMENWRHTFGAIIRELRCGNYGFISDFVQPQYFNWNYIGHNLLGKMNNDVNRAIQNAKLITMVKFVSAAACKDTAEMVKKIFRSLKPGALVLFIDNDAGGFYNLVVKGAQESSMVTVFGPLIHEHYINKSFDVRRFGYTPCLETKVTVHMWMKPNYNRLDIMSAIALGNPPQIQTRNLNNTFNQYSLLNTNIYVPETSVPHIPVQRQGHILPSSSSKMNAQAHNSQKKAIENQSSNLPVHRQSQNPVISSSSSKATNLSQVHNIAQKKTMENSSSHIPVHRQQQDPGIPSSSSKMNNLNRAQKATQNSRPKTSNRVSHSPTRKKLPTSPVSSQISETKKLNCAHGTPQKEAIQNPRQHYARSQSLHTAIQTQPQPVPNRAPSDNQNNRESEADCCNCCVIS